MSGNEKQTVRQLQAELEAVLTAAGCDSPSFDVMCLLEDLGGLGRGRVAAAADRTISDEVARRLRQATARRAAGEPLQYLLGTWDFLSLTLEVGPGVLIPRQDTELLCEVAADWLRKTGRRTVWDLCAGSGCVSLGIASLYPSATVHAVELSDAAFSYLQNNCRRYPQYSVCAEQGDVLCPAAFSAEPADLIVSNPPYIPTAELEGLQWEVRQEPSMALDGGADGYRFYRVIASVWSKRLTHGGALAVEIGIGQADTVRQLFAEAGLTDIAVHRDAAGKERVVFAIRP